MMVEELIELRNKATEHYDWILIYAGTKFKDDPVALTLMIIELKEGCTSVDCAFCNEFRHLNCLLSTKVLDGGQLEYCGGRLTCCDGLYAEMVDSFFWREFIFRAWAVRHFIVKRVDEEIERLRGAA